MTDKIGPYLGEYILFKTHWSDEANSPRNEYIKSVVLFVFGILMYIISFFTILDFLYILTVFSGRPADIYFVLLPIMLLFGTFLIVGGIYGIFEYKRNPEFILTNKRIVDFEVFGHHKKTSKGISFEDIEWVKYLEKNPHIGFLLIKTKKKNRIYKINIRPSLTEKSKKNILEIISNKVPDRYSEEIRWSKKPERR